MKELLITMVIVQLLPAKVHLKKTGPIGGFLFSLIKNPHNADLFIMDTVPVVLEHFERRY